MAMPLDLDTILSDFAEEDTAWTLRDLESGQYVTIPHQRYHGRHIFYFFMSSEDAKKVLHGLDLENPKLKKREIYPYEVKLKASLRALAADPENGFVMHTPNEVFEFLDQRLGS